MYWLIPTKTESELFREIIRILAKQFDEGVFMPHLTLCRAGDAKNSGKTLNVRTAPVCLRISGIGHSAKFTKALFVRFAASKSLHQLVSQLGGKPKGLSDPHVSLLYKKLPAGIRRDLAAVVKLPFRAVTFDSIIAMSCVSPTKTKRDVQSWRRIATKRLSG
jgi:hypothetical protein